MQITHMQDILSYRVELCQKLENAHRDSPGFQGSPNACDIIYEKVWLIYGVLSGNCSKIKIRYIHRVNQWMVVENEWASFGRFHSER